MLFVHLRRRAALMRSTIATLLGIALFFAAARALAQEPAMAWPPKTTTDWLIFVSFCGTIVNVVLTAIAARFPQATWAGDLAHVIGALPVINVHGLTLGMQERVQLKKLTAAAVAAAPKA